MPRRLSTSAAAPISPLVDLSDHATVLAGISTPQLATASLIFGVCQRQALMGPLLTVLRAAGSTALGAPLLAVVRRTAFRHFCAGETLQDCGRVARQMRSAAGVRLLVDHSVEERETAADWALNLRNKRALLGSCAETLGDGVAFVPVKVTALASPALLEAMTRHIHAAGDGYLDAEVDPRTQLSAEEAELLGSALENMGELCAEAQRLRLPVLFDAEQSHRQPAIDFVCRRLQARFNRCEGGAPPVVYNTFQMYMVGAERRLARDLEHAREGGFVLAAKVVRGAYLVSEAERAAETGAASPILKSKGATDVAYDRGISALLRSIAKDQSAAVLIATHNQQSVELAAREMERLGLPRNHPRVSMAQIMGMCDNLTLALGLAGYNSHKLVLYGDFGEVFPWLLRRLDENRDMLGAAQLELPLIRAELRRRLIGK